jgi:hypothetical protein
MNKAALVVAIGLVAVAAAWYGHNPLENFFIAVYRCDNLSMVMVPSVINSNRFRLYFAYVHQDGQMFCVASMLL